VIICIRCPFNLGRDPTGIIKYQNNTKTYKKKILFFHK
jgi:hypothetical protein